MRSSRRSVRFDPAVAIAATVAITAVIAALLSPWLVPDAMSQSLTTGVTRPSADHWLGTDRLGRDVAELLIAGARTSVFGAVAITAGSMAIGNVIGLYAGFAGGMADAVAMRWVDIMFSVPALLVAIVVAGLFGGGLVLAVVVLAVLFSPNDARVVRAAVLEQRHLPYIEAATLLDLSARKIALRHVWPNAMPIILPQVFLNFAFALVALASLSFLGLGVPAGSPDWGRTLTDNKDQLFTNPWAAVAPAIAIVATAAAVNIMGDWVAEQVQRRGLAR